LKKPLAKGREFQTGGHPIGPPPNVNPPKRPWENMGKGNFELAETLLTKKKGVTRKVFGTKRKGA